MSKEEQVPNFNRTYVNPIIDSVKYNYEDSKKKTVELGQEINTECIQVVTSLELQESIKFVHQYWLNFVHIPYLPSFHSPGWLLRYFLGPYNLELGLSAFGDFWAGITVAMTLIPQVSLFILCTVYICTFFFKRYFFCIPDIHIYKYIYMYIYIYIYKNIYYKFYFFKYIFIFKGIVVCCTC
jgi:hypothetical protein